MFFFKKIFFISIVSGFFLPFFLFAVTDSTQIGLEVISSEVLGCTDSNALNYNASATIDDGSCSYGGGGGDDPITPPEPEDVYGCTDDNALNYNPEATIDDESCIYPAPLNVTNFSVGYSQESKRAELSWENPSVIFSVIRIVRLENSIPSGPNEGVLIYQGRGESAEDFGVEMGKNYYYAAFTRNFRGEFSSGAIASLDLSEDDDDEEEDDDEDDDDGDNDENEGDGGGGEDPDPFAHLSLSTSTPLMEASWFLRLLQPGEPVQLFDRGATIYIKGGKSLTLEMNYKQVPKVLKTIGVTFVDTENPDNVTAIILKVSSDKKTYTATLPTFAYGGMYEMYIYLIDYGNQTIVPTKGRISVSGVRPPGAEFLSLAGEAAAPAAMASGLAVGFFPSLSDIFNYVIRLFGYLFGRRKKGKPWGTVYDSVTKRPLDPAYVSVEKVDSETNLSKEMTSAITDIDGRFGFLLPAGQYVLKANKTHYQFPSEKLQGKESDELYDNLYFGQTLNTEGEEVTNLNIPMDPIGFDWNEFAKTKTDFFRFYSKKELWRNRIFNFIFSLGFIVSGLTLLFNPSILNVVLVLLYLAVYILNKVWRSKYKPHRLLKKETGEPLPFSIIRLFLPGVDQQVKNVVTDQFGNFYILVRPGNYYYTIEEKIADGSYQKIFQSEPIELKKGVFSSNLEI